MATITLKYDARNTILKNMIEAFIALGGEVESTSRTTKSAGYASTLSAIEELKQGKGIKCGSFANYKEKMA